MTIAGSFVWLRGRRGFVCEKRPASYERRADDVEPVAVFPLNAEEYGMSILILEQRYPCGARLEDEPKVRLESARS